MLGITELDIKILLYLDIKTLKTITFLNKSIYNIIFSKQFWGDKFKYDNLPILDNIPSFQEYTKINDCKNKVGQFILDYKKEYIKINIDGKDLLVKILSERYEEMKLPNYHYSFIKIMLEKSSICIGFDVNPLALYYCDMCYDEIIQLLIRCSYHSCSFGRTPFWVCNCHLNKK